MYSILYDTKNNQSLNKKILQNIRQNKGMGISNSYEPMVFNHRLSQPKSKKYRIPYKQI